MTSKIRGDCEITVERQGALRVGSPSGSTGDPADDAREDGAVVPTFTFQIFIDFRGMYRWLLLSPSGQSIRQSRHGYAGLAAAWRDAEAARDGGHYLPAEIAGPSLVG